MSLILRHSTCRAHLLRLNTENSDNWNFYLPAQKVIKADPTHNYVIYSVIPYQEGNRSLGIEFGVKQCIGKCLNVFSSSSSRGADVQNCERKKIACFC